MNALVQNRDLREIWSLWLPIGLQQCRARAHFTAWWILEQIVQLWIHWVRWNGETVKVVAKDSNNNSASSSQVWHTDSEPNSSTGKLVARSKKSTISPNLIPHNLTVSPHSVWFLDKVFKNVRQKLGRPKEVHEGSCTYRKRFSRQLTWFEKHRILWDSALFLHHAEIGLGSTVRKILGVSTVDWDQTPWMKSTLVHEHAINLLTAKLYVF